MNHVDNFLETLTLNTANTYKMALIHLERFADGRDITADLMAKFVKWTEGQDWTPATRRLYFLAISRYHYFLHNHELISAQEWAARNTPIELALADIPRPVLDEKELPTADEIKAIADTLDNPPKPRFAADRLAHLRDRALFMLIMATGIRISEACGLVYADVDWLRGWLKLTVKGNKPHRLPLPPDLMIALREYRDLRRELKLLGYTSSQSPLFIRHDKKASKRQLPMSTRTGDNIFQYIKNRAGVACEFTPHTLRHYAATNLLAKSGGNAFLVGHILAHNSLDTTADYVHDDKEASLAELKRLGNALLEPI